MPPLTVGTAPHIIRGRVASASNVRLPQSIQSTAVNPALVNATLQNPHRQPRKGARVLAVSILGLVLGLVVLAIAAKSLHYSARSTETRYFSQSVKIAKYGSVHIQQAPRVAVAAPRIDLESPQAARAEFVTPKFPAVAPVKTGPKQLRSPPSFA